MKYVVALETNKLLGLPYTPRYQYVNLVINNNYRGSYLLTESVNRNKHRIDVSKDGYIIEADAYWWNEDIYFKTDKVDEHFGYTFKYPKTKDIDDKSISYIKDYILEFEKSISDGRYEKYIDLDSWASWLMVHDLLGNWDGGGSNIYLSKYDNSDSTKLVMPVTWDYDAIFMMKDKWASIHDAWFYFHLLFNSANPAFAERYYTLYKEKASNYYKAIDNYILQLAVNSTSLDVSKKLDAERWDYQYKPLKDEITEVRHWFKERKNWMDSEIDKISE